MPGTISFDGLATGINTTETVDKIIEVASRPKILKEAEKVRYENQRDSWQEINSKLLNLREVEARIHVHARSHGCVQWVSLDKIQGSEGRGPVQTAYDHKAHLAVPLEKMPLATPKRIACATAAPTKPPPAAVPLKAPLKTSASAPGIRPALSTRMVPEPSM